MFLEQYVTAGGHEDALAARGGLPAGAGALGRHRMWAVEWFMEQAIRWIDAPANDPAYIPVVRRHLNGVVQLLEVQVLTQVSPWYAHAAQRLTTPQPTPSPLPHG